MHFATIGYYQEFLYFCVVLMLSIQSPAIESWSILKRNYTKELNFEDFIYIQCHPCGAILLAIYVPFAIPSSELSSMATVWFPAKSNCISSKWSQAGSTFYCWRIIQPQGIQIISLDMQNRNDLEVDDNEKSHICTIPAERTHQCDLPNWL